MKTGYTLLLIFSFSLCYSQSTEKEYRKAAELKHDEKKFTEAISILDDAISKGFTDTYVYFDRAVYKKMAGDCEGAIVDMDKALETLVYGGLEGIIVKGQCMLELGQYDKAIETFNKLVNPNMPFGDPLYYRGLAKIGLGDTYGACLDLNRALNMNYNHLTKVQVQKTVDKNCQ